MGDGRTGLVMIYVVIVVAETDRTAQPLIKLILFIYIHLDKLRSERVVDVLDTRLEMRVWKEPFNTMLGGNRAVDCLRTKITSHNRACFVIFSRDNRHSSLCF